MKFNSLIIPKRLGRNGRSRIIINVYSERDPKPGKNFFAVADYTKGTLVAYGHTPIAAIKKAERQSYKKLEALKQKRKQKEPMKS
jgi:hypothetical protein